MISDLQLLFDSQRNKALSLRNSNYRERLQHLHALKTAILQHEDELIQAMYADFRKPAAEVRTTELALIYKELQWTMARLKSWMKPRKVGSPFPYWLAQSSLYREPKGRTLIISPWNFPIQLAIIPLIGAIAGGNTVILKPSELTPHTSSVLEKMLTGAFKSDHISVLQGDATVASSLLSLPFDHIFFTGSTAVGKLVMEAAAKNLGEITLELGGKSAAIIEESATMQDATEKLVWGKTLNAGQSCVAPDYVLINKDMIPLFTEKLKATYAIMFPNESWKTNMCSIVNQRHFERLQVLIEDALTKGATLSMGGGKDDSTRTLEFTVLTGVTREMKIMQEEIFGPVVPILGYGHLEDAIAEVNAYDKPLALYLFTKNKYAIQKVKQNTSSGALTINDYQVHFTNPKLPFGGINQSGIGQYHGKYSFDTFTHEKPVFRQAGWININKPLYPPMGKLGEKTIWLLEKIFKR
jgi:aldehyde dehydrogenase (NAD+)